jgi:hypothetical protein
LLSAQPLTASPDLALNTLTHFLDRFVYKNPKQARAKGSSAMQPGATPADGSGVKRVRGEVADPGGLVNEAAFARRREEDVPVDQVRRLVRHGRSVLTAGKAVLPQILRQETRAGAPSRTQVRRRRRG